MFAIQTKGRADYDDWTESYRLEYSRDCVTFNTLLNVNGNNHVRTFFSTNTFRNHQIANWKITMMSVVFLRMENDVLIFLFPDVYRKHGPKYSGWEQVTYACCCPVRPPVSAWLVQNTLPADGIPGVHSWLLE